MSRLLLCTDLDRTLLPNGAAPESPRARPLFQRLVARAEVKLVYVTGRDQALVAAAVAEYAVPEPRVLICDVGTTIAERQAGSWHIWPDWAARLATAWGGRHGDDVRRQLGDLPGLQLQPASRQGPFKVSYEGPEAPDPDALLAQVQERLAAVGIPANVIVSIDDVVGNQLVDVLPPTATKRQALEHIRQALGYRHEEMLFAGDSGNDLDALISAIPAVVVANATDAVKSAARRGAAEAGHADRLHVAADGELGMNGNYAAGILAGVRHFHPAWAVTLDGTE